MKGNPWVEERQQLTDKEVTLFAKENTHLIPELDFYKLSHCSMSLHTLEVLN